MEEQGRDHTITPALNRELLFFGVPRVLFVVSVVIGVFVFLFTWSFILSLFLFLFLLIMCWWLTADDPALPAILASALRMSALFDPFEKRRFDLRWK